MQLGFPEIEIYYSKNSGSIFKNFEIIEIYKIRDIFLEIEIYSGFGAANLAFIRDFRDLFDNLNVVEYGISAFLY